MPEEQKVRFRKSLKEYYKTHDGYWKDKKFTKEHRRKLAAAHKGKPGGRKGKN